MKKLIVDSYGKINLALDILYKRDDGYHEINSLMQSIDLKDILTFREIEKGIEIQSNDPELPLDSENLVYKAWKSLEHLNPCDRGISIYIDKQIPMAAGLAGGSSNAAATLKALNKIWGLKLCQEELMLIGKDIGADIPFCIEGGTSLAQGIGERLTSIASFKNKHILLCNPGIQVSTKEAYQKINPNGERIDMDALITCIEKDDVHCLASKMSNKMEAATIKDYPIIQDIKDRMMEEGALGALMSGSGPTVFGIYDDEAKMKRAKEILRETWSKVYICKTI